MWNKRPGYLLLIQISQHRKNFVIPLALPVVEATLKSLGDSLEIWESFFPGLWARLLPKPINNHNIPLSISQLLSGCIRLLNEIRRYGSFEFVKIDDGESRISIRLW